MYCMSWKWGLKRVALANIACLLVIQELYHGRRLSAPTVRGGKLIIDVQAVLVFPSRTLRDKGVIEFNDELNFVLCHVSYIQYYQVFFLFQQMFGFDSFL